MTSRFADDSLVRAQSLATLNFQVIKFNIQAKMRAKHPLVHCTVCNFISNRKKKEDGSFGFCKRCGGKLEVGDRKEMKRFMRARLELQSYEKSE